MSEETKLEKPSLLGMIWSPTEQFERMRERPAIWGAMIVVMILSAARSWLLSFGVEVPEIEGVPEDQLAGFEAFGQALAVIGGFVIPLITVFIVSLIYLLVAKMAQSNVAFKQLFALHTHIAFIGMFGMVLNGIVAVLVGGAEPGVLYTSLGSLIETEGAAASVFDSLEVFSIWQLILTALGLHKVAGFLKRLAWTVPIVFFVIGILMTMMGTSFNGMVGV